MAMYDYHDGREVPQYYDYPSPHSLAPMMFLDPRRPEDHRRDDRYMDDANWFNYRLHPEVYRRDSRYMDDEYWFKYRQHPEVYPGDDRSNMDDGYRSNYRLQDNWDHSRHGHIPQEQVVRRDGVAPTWPVWEYPNYGGYAGMYLPWGWETRVESSDEPKTVEMYVPLCCDECERKVCKHLKKIEGVESVVADQWEKKVVVNGKKLQPDVLLRRAQRDKAGSVFWSDRSH